jgi:hypothetical protein
MKSAKFAASGTYRPHIVVGPVEQRNAILDGQSLVEDYIGVSLIGGPEKVCPGETAEVEMALMYPQSPMHHGLQAGATFTVREVPTIVGFGTVLSDVERPPLTEE